MGGVVTGSAKDAMQQAATKSYLVLPLVNAEQGKSTG
jgi:hypothetical protein